MGSAESTLSPAMEEATAATNNRSSETSARGRRTQRHRRLTETETQSIDDPWWWEVENENLILDQAVTTSFREASVEPDGTPLSEDFNTLLKIGENINLTLNNGSSEEPTTTTTTIDAAAANEIDAVTQKTDYPVTTFKETESVNANESEAVVNPTDTTSKVAEIINSSEIETIAQKTDDYPITICKVTEELNALTAREQSLEEFKEELRVKRLARQSAVQDLRAEIASLRSQLSTERDVTRRLRSGEAAEDAEVAPAEDEGTASALVSASVSAAAVVVVCGEAEASADVVDADDEDPLSRSRHANIELANAQLALQLANADNLSLRTELGVVQKQVLSLKEVIACCKQMLAVKEEQCTQLKTKLSEIETSFGEREMKIMSDNLRQEYERQLGNIRQLRQLYEERQRISAAEHENLQRLISIKRDELAAEQEKTKNFEERNQTLMKEVEGANNELAALRDECNEHKFEKKALKEEMGTVNTLFSQMVLGFNGKNNLDIDRLTTMLEENRTLLNDMATKEANCSDGATLPKLLFELVEQAAVSSGSNRTSRSPTPNYVADEDIVDEEAEETEKSDEQQQITPAKSNEDNVDNVDPTTTNESTASTTVAEHVAGDATDEQQAQTSVEQQDVVGVIGVCEEQDNNTDNNSAANNSSAGNTIKSSKKHQRKNVGNKTATVALASTSARAAAMSMRLHEPEVIGKVASAQEIIGNLPKVWKVLMELLSHHKIEQVQFEENGAGEDCYKSVETPNGPKAELSVSKTYIKLKDLILEKKSLVKETNRLKTLNSHLDYRLNEQEKRLSAVSLELTKTWHLVGKMQRQHRQLHTQEQILRYQLQQKRRLLSELKDELEYCRRKWAAARAKNDESQEQFNDLRREFARRKLEDANNSAESGYSDSGPPSDEEERAAAAAAIVVAATGMTTMMTTAAGGVTVANGVIVGGGSGACRRKHLKEMFEHTRKIKRMQSTSPGRAGCAAATAPATSDEIVLRWNSAPPTCGWPRAGDEDDDEASEAVENDDLDDENEPGGTEYEKDAVETSTSTGAIPKNKAAHSSRSIERGRRLLQTHVGDNEAVGEGSVGDAEQRVERTIRIQRLEEQCKSLIQQVLETSDNREKLEVQLCRFQDEIAPVQYAVPIDEFINKKRIERMTRASSAPAQGSGSGSGSLTPREEEYTRKRSERLGRLEEESRQLMSRIKRTSDRGHYLRCSLDRIRRAPSREGSFESNTEEEVVVTKVETENASKPLPEAEKERTHEIKDQKPIPTGGNINPNSPLTAEEEAFTARRAARLQRLEEESKLLLTKLSRNSQRGNTIGNRLDALHERYGGESETPTTTSQCEPMSDAETPTSFEQRIEHIEKISSNREQRLRILEEEGKQLLTRLSNTSERGTQMINRIAERELQKQARSSATPNREESSPAQMCAVVDKDGSPTPDDTPVTACLMPLPKNVACSSIVGEELAERVTVTMTASQIAAQQQQQQREQQGAIPKSKPTALLSAARLKGTSKQHKLADSNSSNETGAESLEEMVRRLQELPFPTTQKPVENVKCEESELEEVQELQCDAYQKEIGEVVHVKNLQEAQSELQELTQEVNRSEVPNVVEVEDLQKKPELNE